MPEPEPIQPPEGFQPTIGPPATSPAEGERPAWLVGADEVLASEEGPAPRPDVPGPVAARLVPPPAVAPGEPAPAPSTPWAPAASSIPKLTVVPKRERPAPSRAMPEDDLVPSGLPDGSERAAVADAAGQAEPPLAPPEEPWWLVWLETLFTNRGLQVGVLAALAAVAALLFWPRKENQSVPIARIKQHPGRFEGQPVRVRGEVGEVFEIGGGYVFHLRQGRDTMVVFSPTRQPTPRDKIAVVGTVSTGYLDGIPRVALFETPRAPRDR